jgi:hypothetical protein
MHVVISMTNSNVMPCVLFYCVKHQAVAKAIQSSGLPDVQGRLKKWNAAAYSLSHNQSK